MCSLPPTSTSFYFVYKKKYHRSLTGEGCCSLVCMCRLQSVDRFRKIIILINSRWWWWVNNTSLMRKKNTLPAVILIQHKQGCFALHSWEAHECKAVWVHLLISKSQRDGTDHNLMLIAVLIYFSEAKRLRAQARFGNIVLEGGLNSSALSEDIRRVMASCVVTASLWAVPKAKYRCVTSNNFRCRM